MEQDYLPRFKLELIKAEKEIKETYTDDELARLLKKPDMKKTDFKEFRTWVMINYVLATGNRLETVSKLNIGDIDFANHQIALLHAKNKTQYFIPLSHDLAQVFLHSCCKY